jgi:hypothetical protein
MPQDMQTGLDDAMRRMAAAPEDTTARLAFHAELSRAELFVLLESEVSGDRMIPRVFDLSDGRAVLAFGSELQLADFAGDAAAYAALPGRVLVTMLASAAEPLSLLIGPDVDHAALLTPDALVWLDQTLSAPAPDEAQATPERFTKPNLPPAVLSLLVPALERRLSGLPGLDAVILAGAEWQGGGRGHVLALNGLPDSAQAPIARAVVEALSLSGLEAGVLDVVFPPNSAMQAIVAVGLPLKPAPFVMPDEQIISPNSQPNSQPGANPGLDPTRPPKLR